MLELLAILVAGIVLGACVSTLVMQRGWATAPRPGTTTWRAVPTIPEPTLDWSEMRSGAMPRDYFEWHPELAPRDHWRRMAERVLDDTRTDGARARRTPPWGSAQRSEGAGQ
jgi:hypothetical protein